MALSKLQKLASKAARNVSTAVKQVFAPTAVPPTIILQGDYQFVDHIDTVDIDTVDTDMGEHAWVMYNQPNHSFAASHFSILGEYTGEEVEEADGEEVDEFVGEEVEESVSEESVGASTKRNSFAPSHFSVLFGGSAFSQCDSEYSCECCRSSSRASSTFGALPAINVVPPSVQSPESVASIPTSRSAYSVRCASTPTSPSLSSSIAAPAPPTTDNFIFEGSYERDGITYNTFVAPDDEAEDDPFSADPFAQATVEGGELVPIPYEPVPGSASKTPRHGIRGHIARLVVP